MHTFAGGVNDPLVGHWNTAVCRGWESMRFDFSSLSPTKKVTNIITTSS